jgi:nucleotide-binding universal stress UspA family protein
MIRNILVGYDGSEAAVHALAFAANLARAVIHRCTSLRSCDRPNSVAWLRRKR